MVRDAPPTGRALTMRGIIGATTCSAASAPQTDSCARPLAMWLISRPESAVARIAHSPSRCLRVIAKPRPREPTREVADVAIEIVERQRQACTITIDDPDMPLLYALARQSRAARAALRLRARRNAAPAPCISTARRCAPASRRCRALKPAAEDRDAGRASARRTSRIRCSAPSSRSRRRNAATASTA